MRHHHVISMVCYLIDQSERGKSLSSCQSYNRHNRPYLGSQNVQDSRITMSHRKSLSLQSFQSPKCNLTNFFFFTIMMASRDTRAGKSLRQLASATNNFVRFGRTKICRGTAQRGQAKATARFVCTDTCAGM